MTQTSLTPETDTVKPQCVEGGFGNMDLPISFTPGLQANVKNMTWLPCCLSPVCVCL